MFTYLLTGSFGEYFLFYGLAKFFIYFILYIYISLRLEGIGSSCPRFYFASSPGDFGGSFNISYHFNYCPANPGSGASPGVWHEICLHLFTTTSLFKTDILYPYFCWRKKVPLPPYVSGQSLALFFLSLAIL